jgi:hypothetical protein
VALHVARVVGPWDGGSVSWAIQPRIEEVGSPVTRVMPASAARVRLDVRELVRRWRRRDGTSRATGEGELSVAVITDEASGTGVTVVLAPAAGLEARADRVLAPVEARSGSPASGDSDPRPAVGRAGAGDVALAGPELELYVR